MDNLKVEKKEVNTLRTRNANLHKHFQVRRDENRSLRKDMEESIFEENLIDCAGNLARLNDNTENFIDMMEEMHSITKDLVNVVDKLINKLENKNALSEYRDWISYFNKEIKEKLPQVGSRAQTAIYKKVLGGKQDYADSDKEAILKVENLLKSVNMSFYDYELLILMKLRSNHEFHRGELQSRAQAKKNLQETFPEEMKLFKEPLQKLFNALDIWWSI
ncbi:3051_t:CDS:1 [Funneliformis geosporum]|uniref:15706_t:CDS:1 n=1 Tax=Funneliformis geosporum TaxID=1117311 RepID=A0A9W4SUM2_9GLOM|nr:15706_t:CDS:1 [Funneliformis geosporum]CAI2183201.1 3051_t:CDS:1 [Funneliformis geosporum]